MSNSVSVIRLEGDSLLVIKSGHEIEQRRAEEIIKLVNSRLGERVGVLFLGPKSDLTILTK